MGKKLSKFFTEGSKFSRVTNRHLACIICDFLPIGSRDKVGTHRSLVRRASAARAILLANAASLYSSQQAAQAVPSQFVAKSGERDGSGASSRTPTLLIFDEKFAISSPSPNSPSKTRDCTGKSNGRLRVQKFAEKFAKFPPHRPQASQKKTRATQFQSTVNESTKSTGQRWAIRSY